MSIQFLTILKEITKRLQDRLRHVADSGIPMGSQTVLLKGINDRPYIMKEAGA